MTHQNSLNEHHNLMEFDVIGDIHGCFDEFIELLQKLNYSISISPSSTIHWKEYEVTHPEKRKIVFVGDYINKGNKNIELLELILSMFKSEVAIGVAGNNDEALLYYYENKFKSLGEDADKTIHQIDEKGSLFRNRVYQFLKSLPSHILLANDNVLICHAGLREEFHHINSEEVRKLAIFGERNTDKNLDILRRRLSWIKTYLGKTKVIFGHTPVKEAIWLNNTLDIDTGCVYGGKLTALRYPSLEIVSITAKRCYVDTKNFTLSNLTIDDL